MTRLDRIVGWVLFIVSMAGIVVTLAMALHGLGMTTGMRVAMSILLCLSSIVFAGVGIYLALVSFELEVDWKKQELRTHAKIGTWQRTNTCALSPSALITVDSALGTSASSRSPIQYIASYRGTNENLLITSRMAKRTCMSIATDVADLLGIELRDYERDNSA